MGYEIIKSKLNPRLRSSYCNKSNTSEQEEEYFNIKIRNKNYPSCYRYNVLIMLAKKLINQEKQH